MRGAESAIMEACAVLQAACHFQLSADGVAITSRKSRPTNSKGLVVTAISPLGIFDQDENGWARRGFGPMSGYGPAPRDSRFTINVGAKLRLSISSLPLTQPLHTTASIDILPSPNAPVSMF